MNRELLQRVRDRIAGQPFVPKGTYMQLGRDSVRCYCFVGAFIYEATGEKSYDGDDVEGMDALELFDREIMPFEDAFILNDTQGREAVLAKLDEVLGRVE